MYLKSNVEKECCGCKACMDICPKKCIVMEENEEGFLYPNINQSKCIQCNLCNKVCPNECMESELKKAKEGYAGVHKNYEIACSSSSGGAFSALCEAAFAENYVVYGAKWDENYHVCHDMAKTFETSKMFRKSKYILSDMNHCYESIVKQLKANQGVLFSGTPCQCAAVKQYIKCYNISTQKLLLVDIVCHGAPAQKIFDKYLDEINGTTIKGFSFRYKADKGKINTRTAQVLYKNGTQKVLDVHNDAFMKGYYGRLFYRTSCAYCKFARIERISDITLGDAWHIENIYQEWDSEKGISMILLNTDKGKNIYEKFKGYMLLKPIEIDWAEQANMQLRKPTQMHPGREIFLKLYKEIGVKKAVNKAMHNSIWKKLHYRIKNVIMFYFKIWGIQLKYIEIIDTLRVKLRERTNLFLGKYRKNKLINQNVTIISNNCWGGHVYRYLGMEYLSPTIGLYFFADDYVKFCGNFKYYMDQELKFIDAENSKYFHEIYKKDEHCPIGILDDIEIFFLHYKTEEEALEKWNRRKKRIVWDNLVFKFSEQNCCSKKEIMEFDKLSYDRKFVFTTKDYHISSQILWGGVCVKGDIPNDTILFREYVDPIKFINGDNCKKRQKYAEKKLRKLNGV